MEGKNKSEARVAHPYSYCTGTTAQTYKHTWAIHNLHLCYGDRIKSGTYSSGDDKDYKWHWDLPLKMKPYPTANLNLCITSPQGSFHVIANVEIRNTQKSIFTRQKEGTAKTSSNFECCFVKVNSGDTYLTFNIELTIIEDFKSLESNVPVEMKTEPSNYWTNLYDDKEYADVVFVVDGETFRAHKAVLANRSSVFRAMFASKMIESKQKKITIADIDSKVFAELLRFVYTDSVPDEKLDTIMATALLQAAEKYDLEKLKTMCEVSLGGCISEESAVNTLVLANLYRADQLKQAVIRFIGRNVGVIQSEEWKDLTEMDFDLANGVMVELLGGLQLK